MSHAGLKHGKFRKRQQCDDNAQKHNRQGNQKNRQGDFIRRFLAFCVFDHGDHPVDEGSPGLTVTLTTMQSDNTFVPAVTAEKSPPDSRMTEPIRR